MAYGFLDTAYTPTIRSLQAKAGSLKTYDGFSGNRAFDRFTAQEREFIAARDTFFMASAAPGGWPYVQHRGGPVGFLKVLDDQTLAFPDYRGNRQYISAGNALDDDRVCLFLIDQAERRRLKIYAHAELLDLDEVPELAWELEHPGYRAQVERIFRLRLKAFDWNCPQHIARRFTEQEIAEMLEATGDRIRQLEQENAALRARLNSTGDQ
ncbi:pyridoxamine 5'-phosphate oxidase family protein [Alteraurantiacibacter aquimixticola]|uniref:Pyridoxamine 5-phosphate oxidase n=1 Tax=Alteraurantiacibacter aquimixticola TaxID=2489173 RepID=A0A4T3F0R7_9SPHN|nr:pyridoxamine 5'-phosphate oxidase family protein [Alteraurantiacibacter aquimixticola]TIX49507.1 pyridoxamine 5-phosphate oxidase [Alteraurantiacibacter aquimixticola]